MKDRMKNKIKEALETRKPEVFCVAVIASATVVCVLTNRAWRAGYDRAIEDAITVAKEFMIV